jgi:uncharacterized protein (DUF1015 family)
MADVIPFAGIRYKASTKEELKKLVAPPYDVISRDYQDELYGRHEKNIVRVDFGKRSDTDSEGENRYTRAKKFLDAWLADGTLVREGAPAIYLYEVEYDAPAGQHKVMTGFVCLLKLEEWSAGIVLPHEGTLKGPKADRFELLRATGMSASQIFSMYTDPGHVITGALKGAVAGRAPDEEVSDDDGSTHRIWVVNDARAIDAVVKAMKEKKVFIADGHHRYETALAYREHCLIQGNFTGQEPFNYVPMFLANMDEDGLTILPTHRLIKDAAGLTVEDVLMRSARYFDIEELPFTGADGGQRAIEFLAKLTEKGKDKHVFGLYFDRGSALYMLTLKSLDPVTEALRCKGSDAYCNLDVTILHELIIERVIGIDTDSISVSQPVQFEKDGVRAIERVRAGEFAMCFLLNATRVHEVKDVALSREIMPQKSTYFYPKLLTGLVIADLNP